jgi:autotransporter-associated beta strand protein
VGTNAAAVTNLVTTATSGTLTINVASGTTYAYGDGSLANSGLISGAVSIVKSGSGAQILGGANTYTGTTTLSAGTLRSGTGTVGNSAFGSGVLALNGGTLTSGTDNGARTFANNVSVGGDVAFGDATATGGLAFSGTVDLGNATRTLTTVQTLTFSGPISNGGLIKSGTALLTMTGNNTYSGATTVSAGGLKVNGVLGSGSLSVAASAWLMGTGTINGPVTISGTLTPGASPGVITLGSLVLTPTSSTVIEIASAGTRGTDYDGVSILDAGGLTYGGTMTLAFGGSAIDNNTTFDVFSFTGSSAGSLAAIESSGFYAGTWTPLGSGTFQLVKDAQTITFSQSSGDVIVVPEPTTITLAAVGLGAMAYAFRRRHIRA